MQKYIPFKRKILIFAFFFVISSFLWLLDSLNHQYKTQIKVPVEYTNLPRNKTFLNNPPQYLTLIVNGYGYNLLQYNLSSKLKRFKINLAEAHIHFDRYNHDKAFLLTADLLDQLNSEIKQNIKILAVRPDTIFFVFTKIYSKFVHVKPDITINYAQQFINKEPPQIIPSKVKLKGPNEILDTIKFVRTQHIVLNNVNKDINLKIKLKLPPKTTATPNKVRLIVKVEQFTEVTISVPIKTLNVPPNYRLILFPNKVRIKYTVGLSEYNLIRPEYFTVYVDYKELKNNPGEKIPVHILHVPSQIYSYSYYPHLVDYILENKKL